MVELYCCAGCSNKVTTNISLKEKMGPSQKIFISCTSCDWKETLFSSPVVDKEENGNKMHEVNLRAVIAFCEIGKGLAAIE